MNHLYTELEDRTLRFDGVSVFLPSQIEEFLLSGMKPNQMRVTELTPDLDRFNANVVPDEQIKRFVDEPINFDLRWNIPDKYLTLNVEQHVLEVFSDILPSLEYDSAQTETAILRVAQELEEIKTRGLEDLIRVMVFVLDEFKRNKQVWGVGRGSSCASFVLFLLGLHVVDSVRYNVPMEEFFHD